MNIIAELSWRGMIQDIIPGTMEQLEKESTTGYIGFDPTADSLHIGSLVPIMLLVHMQRSGHKPIALVGGATGVIGDPTGKSEERKMLNEDELQKNVAAIQRQLQKFLSFDSTLPNAAEMANNFDWFKQISFLDFIKEAGRHITVNYMLAKDSVKKRLDSDAGMTFTEFSYQLVQGYDFFHLYTNNNCKLQMGGSDQWGNIVTGTELIRRKTGGNAFAFTCPLLKKADGGKFGKSEKGNIWLDPAKTSPYQFYQFWLNAKNEDAENWISIFTFLSQAEIDALISKHREDDRPRLLQKKLAEEVTRFVHSEEDLAFAMRASNILFGSDTAAALASLTEEMLLQVMDGVPTADVSLDRLKNGYELINVLTETKIFDSKGDAKKMLAAGAISINKKKTGPEKTMIEQADLLQEKYLLIQKGKKNYYLLRAV